MQRNNYMSLIIVICLVLMIPGITLAKTEVLSVSLIDDRVNKSVQKEYQNYQDYISDFDTVMRDWKTKMQDLKNLVESEDNVSDEAIRKALLEAYDAESTLIDAWSKRFRLKKPYLESRQAGLQNYQIAVLDKGFEGTSSNNQPSALLQWKASVEILESDRKEYLKLQKSALRKLGISDSDTLLDKIKSPEQAANMIASPKVKKLLRMGSVASTEKVDLSTLLDIKIKEIDVELRNIDTYLEELGKYALQISSAADQLFGKSNFSSDEGSVTIESFHPDF